MLEIFYNSRDTAYKSIFGAVQCATLIKFRIDVRCDAPVKAAIIINHISHEMQIDSLTGDLSVFTLSLHSLHKPGLMYYHFEVSTPYHTVYYGNDMDMLQGIGKKYDKKPLDYQITVYDKFNTPDWIKGRVMYQIFPDRFYKDNIKLSPYWNRYFHENWYEDPYIEGDFKSGTMECSDFFGGNLDGIIKKLDYIKSLGVGVIYLNPIYLAYSNHRYDVADYMSVDDTLGEENDLRILCEEAKKRDIYIILDMVFSHTGSDSVYFNKNMTFGYQGAFNDKQSEYRSWYVFKKDNTYESWWGIETLPNTIETNPSFMSHTLSSLEKWMNLGIKGFRLDVADELPDEYIKALRSKIKSIDNQSVLIGEVWEDASNKSSYGKKREYLYGYELDSVMNYPYRDALINYTLGKIDAKTFCRKIEIIRENYPKQVYECLMNMLSTHDVSRILSVLGGKSDFENIPRNQQKNIYLNKEEYEIAVKRLNFIISLLICLPGVPTIYYADEAGSQGLKDPFNRRTYPWGKEDLRIFEIYKGLLKERSSNELLKYGTFSISEKEDKILIKREYGQKTNTFIFNNTELSYTKI